MSGRGRGRGASSAGSRSVTTTVSGTLSSGVLGGGHGVYPGGYSESARGSGVHAGYDIGASPLHSQGASMSAPGSIAGMPGIRPGFSQSGLPRPEQQILFRVPAHLAEVLDRVLESGTEEDQGCFIRFYQDGTALVQPTRPSDPTGATSTTGASGSSSTTGSSSSGSANKQPTWQALRAKLVDLPCAIETYKTFTSDASTVFKSGDIRQMLIVEGGQEPDFVRANKSIAPGLPKLNHAHKRRILQATPTFHTLCETGTYPHGLTMPAFDIRKRVYNKEPKLSPKSIADIESRIRIQLRDPGRPVNHESYMFVPREEAERVERQLGMENKYFQQPQQPPVQQHHPRAVLMSPTDSHAETPTPLKRSGSLKMSLSRSVVSGLGAGDTPAPTPTAAPSLTLKLSPSAVALAQKASGGDFPLPGGTDSNANAVAPPAQPGKYVVKLSRAASTAVGAAPGRATTPSAAAQFVSPAASPRDVAPRLQSGEQPMLGGQTPQTDMGGLADVARTALPGTLDDEDEDEEHVRDDIMGDQSMSRLATVRSQIGRSQSSALGFSDWGTASAEDEAAAAAAAAAGATQGVQSAMLPQHGEDDSFPTLAGIDLRMDMVLGQPQDTTTTGAGRLEPLPSVSMPLEPPPINRQVSYDPFANARIETEYQVPQPPQPQPPEQRPSQQLQPDIVRTEVPPHLAALHEEVQRCQVAVARAREALEQAPNAIVKKRKRQDLDAAEAKLKEIMEQYQSKL